MHIVMFSEHMFVVLTWEEFNIDKAQQTVIICKIC